MTPELEDKLNAVLENQKRQQESIDEMNNALLGNKKYGIKGMVAKVNEHADKLEEYDKLKQKGTGFLAAVGFVGGLMGTGVTILINYLRGH